MQKPEKTIFFENLDGLRALAFGMVFIYHFFGYVGYSAASGIEQSILTNFILQGHLGVNLFFVLSGFLITYLLLAEKENTGRIRIGYFYMRRVLRIWPLYFLAVLIGFFLYPLISGQYSAQTTKEHLPWYVFFLNNLDRIRSGFTGTGNDNLGVLWSIAVEEQFYFFWPLLLSLFNKKYYLPLFLFLIAVSLAYRSLFVADESRLYLHSFSVMSDLVTGALLAWCCLYNTKVYTAIVSCSRSVILFTYLLLVLTIFTLHWWSQLNAFTVITERLILAIFFAFVIAEQCFAKNSVLKLGRFKGLGAIGLISYGLYCLHLYVITVIQKVNQLLHYSQIPKWLFYIELILCLGASLALCYISYHYFEKRFLKLKHRFTTVATRTP